MFLLLNSSNVTAPYIYTGPYIFHVHAYNFIFKVIHYFQTDLPPMLEAYEETRLMMDAQIMIKIGVKVVGMTTSGAARMRKLISAVAPKIGKNTLRVNILVIYFGYGKHAFMPYPCTSD